MTESAIFVVAVKLHSPAARAAYLDETCGANADLRRQVEELLRLHEQGGSFLDQPAVAPAQTVDEAPANGAAVAAHPDLLPAEIVGTVVAGRYKLLQQIGEGGMGSVFMAEQTQPVKRMVAFKVVKAGMDSKQVLARFESERQALALMDHPNIARVLDAGTTERGHPFFVMELVKGVPLTQFCDDRQLSVGDRLKVFQQICHAVQHAHQKGIIHRDLKPTNILVESHDGRPVPKVIDFGLAKAMHSLPLTERSLFTNFGAMLGTPLYMAPEQAEFSAIDVDTRADIYALGVILYELLTGTTPLEKKRFAEAAWDEIRRVIKEEEPQTPSARLSKSEARASIAARRQSEPHKLGKFVRGDLDWIVMKALAKERDRRYETANALAADVERFLNDEPVSAGPPTVAYKLRKFVHRNRGQVTVAAILLFALFAGVAVSTWQAVRAKRAAILAREAEGRAVEEQEKTAQALTIAELNRQEADAQRRKAETQAASLAVDIDLKYCEDGEVALGLLRLAQTLRTIPEQAKELRECVALNILAWGQQFSPALPALGHDGYSVTQAVLSPEGLTVLTSGPNGIALWDALTGKQRAILRDSRPGPEESSAKSEGQIQFSGDGQTALTLNGNRHVFYSSDGRMIETVNGGDRIVRLWNAASGQLRAATTAHPGDVIRFRLSHQGSLLVTCCVPSTVVGTLTGPSTVFFWNATSGQLIRKVDLQGQYPEIDVSPDGKSVLIAQASKVEVWFPEEGSPPKRLIANETAAVSATPVAFSPGGRTAVTGSLDAVRWWNTTDWQLQQKFPGLEKHVADGSMVLSTSLAFVHEDILTVTVDRSGPGLGAPTENAPLVFVRNLPEPILGKSKNQARASPNGALVAFDANEVYEAKSGQRLPLPPGRKFHPELRQFTDDGRYALFPGSFVADLAVDKKIGSNMTGRFLKEQNAWIGIDPSNRILLVRKTDASSDAALLLKWCQVVTRGKLDEGGRYNKLDEAAWEKQRQELALQLQANPNAQVLRTAVADRLYWLRQEIEDSPASLPLLDRLVAAEPIWRNYSRRAEVHYKLEHWDQAIRDQLEAARLRGDRYWLQDNLYLNWALGAHLVQAPNRPREQYELALRWAEARRRAGVSEGRAAVRQDWEIPLGDEWSVGRTLMIGLAQFRLGRYADALATLREGDRPKYSQAAGMLVSPWNLLTVSELENKLADKSWPTLAQFAFAPADLAVRAMCHHHLGQPKEAGAYLRHTRELLGKEGGSTEQRALLREAETLIEGKTRKE